MRVKLLSINTPMAVQVFFLDYGLLIHNLSYGYDTLVEDFLNIAFKQLQIEKDERARLWLPLSFSDPNIGF